MQPQADPFIVPVCHDEIEILYQDEALILINKPSGLLSLSGKHPDNKDSVHFRLVQDFPSCTMIHRLDFGTSGIMLVAMNKQVNAQLCKQFSERTVSKRYTALLHGHLKMDEGLIDFAIAKDTENFPLMKVCQQTGKPAVSKFKVLERFVQTHNNAFFQEHKKAGDRAVTRVEFEPVSGRTHQLRLHSQQIKHPILGCDLYATDEAFFTSSRLLLHASELSFDHPITGERMNIISPSPF
ncbi:pseudouridine synthase [Shewanella sediminis HAW-EB3]|uniref:Pseudouridine synthase n=1 Tax=Shewanella sediminis (strain HAW-EB3) TaxID=425104 RepID=A8FVI6_SHESH|nr:pseudouridine synthase [Shewanella sediminis]ABV36859.1 pseudouridine synthase [Shewanella sediminis HAW-EB3]